MPWPAIHLSVGIRRAPGDVYAYASDPARLPTWAAGLASGIHRAGDEWVAQSPMGEVRVRFAPSNRFGVLDHDVTLPDGSTVHNPMRVQANGDGSEVVFTLHRRPGVGDDAFAADAAAVRRDLERLRGLLEAR